MYFISWSHCRGRSTHCCALQGYNRTGLENMNMSRLRSLAKNKGFDFKHKCLVEKSELVSYILGSRDIVPAAEVDRALESDAASAS